jgi:DNA mismatch endonuclease, patch repair protein
MAAIRSFDTAPELIVRRAAHALGYRFRLHVCDLPGRPDIVFPSRRKVVFVHGCFWHQHRCRRWSSRTLTNDYWGPKLRRNHDRDQLTKRAIRRLGWKVLVIWECHVRDRARLDKALRSFLQ